MSIARPAWVTDWQDRPDTTPEQVVDAARDADAVITNKVRIGRAELEQLPNLRFICVAATGYPVYFRGRGVDQRHRQRSCHAVHCQVGRGAGRREAGGRITQGVCP
ncbi:hypothetical protein [Pseudomonas sp. GM79]|uniref:hypothetical protein n=1 Tax=Pseudomonas sp. GM79 TaxID=1144338 RepID=UPI001EE67C79|nr:hypothetical protein [Pseudomonas sp. GM79]